MSAVFLSRTPGSVRVGATSDSTVQASVTVPDACSISGTTAAGSEHNATIPNGQYRADIGETTLRVVCNDNSGYSVYAIGYSNDTDGNTNMIGANTSLTIPTGLVTNASVSNWAMKLTAVSGTHAPTILSDTEGPFTAYHTIPSTATKVATYATNVNPTSGSEFKTTFAIGIDASQAADTYNGKVKFTLVHPSYANADGSVPITDISELDYMQDFATLTSTEKTAVLNSMTLNQQYQLKDNRDQKDYYVAKLADGNVWMTQNLDHDIVTTTNFYTYANTDIGHGATTNTSAKWTAQTATYATNDTTWIYTTDNPESYDPGDLCWNGTIAPDYSGTLSTYAEACGNDKHYHIGNYYNWTAAVAMNDSSSYTTDLTDVDQSICPAGWRLPTYSGNKSYDNLITTLSLTAGTSGNVQSAPAYFVYGGLWDGESYDVGGHGLYWSSVVYGDANAYAFDFDRHGSMGPQYDVGRDGGSSVRCVARQGQRSLFQNLRHLHGGEDFYA